MPPRKISRSSGGLMLAVALTLALGLVACGGSSGGGSSGSQSPSAAGTPQQGGTMSLAYLSEPSSLDPAVAWNVIDWQIEHAIYQGMLQYTAKPGDAGNVLIPCLATEVPSAANGGISADGLTYTFHLRKGVKFLPPVTREVTAKEGDTVEAGDTLSDGTPNPAEIAQYKGIGEGRRYFLNKFADMLKRNGASTGRRNLELFSRAFISKVRINQPEGWNGYLPDDVVDYERIASKWEPREGSETKPLSMASGKYLEKPYLHYTIGTRVTPKVAAELNEFGHSKVLVHNAPPPFEPVVVRSQDLIRHDPDWVTRLGGENLKRALLDSAQRGGTSEKNSTSYFPRLVGMGSGA